jgi:uncharacterized integral membrane protein
VADEQQPPRPSGSESAPPARRDDDGIPWKLVIWGIVALYAVIFLLVNSKRSDVNFVFFTVRTRLIWLILLSMALGFALGQVGPRWWRGRRERRRRGTA